MDPLDPRVVRMKVLLDCMVSVQKSHQAELRTGGMRCFVNHLTGITLTVGNLLSQQVMGSPFPALVVGDLVPNKDNGNVCVES